jgi:hypothetical protein
MVIFKYFQFIFALMPLNGEKYVALSSLSPEICRKREENPAAGILEVYVDRFCIL